MSTVLTRPLPRSRTPDDVIPLLLAGGMCVWTIALYFYSTGAP